MTRQEAKAQGLTRYYTGKPCLRGHVSERLVINSTCCECNAAHGAAYAATYYAANKAKVLAYKAAHYEANKDKIAAKQVAWREKNKDKIAALYAANKANRAAYAIAYAKGNAAKIASYREAWREANKAKIAAQKADYEKTNPHIKNAINAKRRAQKLQATPPWADLDAIKAIYEQAAFLSKVLGEAQHVDHIIPLQGKKVCGLHVAANLQILSATDNIKKGNKLLPTYETQESTIQ
jgi:5-methylcytosine-specific restriction endonuclease McrA